MKKIFISLAVCLLLAPIFAGAQDEHFIDPVLAAPRPDEYFRARVTDIIEEGRLNEDVDKQYYQTVKTLFLGGSEEGREEEITTTNIYPNSVPGHRLEAGDIVVVTKTYDFDGNPIYMITDRYRLDSLLIIAGFFILLAIWLGRWRGLTSLFGLAFSILVLAFYIVPQILDGKNPFFIVLSGSAVIVTISLYLAHGFNRRTSIALGSTLITLAATVVMSLLFVLFGKLFGLGSEDAYFLLAAGENINLQGLLLGGIIIGTLGVLDDITTAQTAVVEELRRANPSLTRAELYKRGLSVGHEHIASLINTLVMAYAGASLPIFLLFTLNTYQPVWTIFNSEFVAEEIVRTLVGSSALILSVPIATFMAAYFLTRPGVVIDDHKGGHTHVH